MTSESADLDRKLLAAHDMGDLAELSRLYLQAADWAEAGCDRDRAAFYLTHAWVFALDSGLSSAGVLEDRLRTWGRC